MGEKAQKGRGGRVKRKWREGEKAQKGSCWRVKRHRKEVEEGRKGTERKGVVGEKEEVEEG